MCQRLAIVAQVVALIVGGIVPCSVTAAQDAAPASLEEQLKAQYKPVKIGSDSNGPSVLEQGTVLVIQKGGVLGVPFGDATVFPSKYHDGNLHSPNSLLVKGMGLGLGRALKNSSQSRYFQVGEKVYPRKIDVSLKNEKITFAIVACDACNGTSPPTFFKSEVIFQFAKAYLGTASVPQVEDTIGQVFAVDTSSAPQNPAGQVGQQVDQQTSQAGQAAAPQAPAQIQLGMTPEEVEAAFGKPEKVVDLGGKKIYVYKDLKVTFVDCKVKDVQ
jgi:hypothetical protein